MIIKGNSVGHPLPDPRRGLDMQGNTFTNLANPVNAGDAANKGYVDAENKKTIKYVDDKNIHHTVVLSASGWVDNLQAVPVTGVTADPQKSDVFASPDTESANYAAYAESIVHVYEQKDGELVFKCKDVPDIDLTVHVLILKQGTGNTTDDGYEDANEKYY